eukprot:9420276-Lingulodinium_polyedra.AAC.1
MPNQVGWRSWRLSAASSRPKASLNSCAKRAFAMWPLPSSSSLASMKTSRRRLCSAWPASRSKASQKASFSSSVALETGAWATSRVATNGPPESSRRKMRSEH